MSFLIILITSVLFLSACSNSFPTAANPNPSTPEKIEECQISERKIFGPDDKIDFILDESDPSFQILAQLSVAKVSSLNPRSSGTLNDSATYYSRSLYPPKGIPLCSDIKFRDQKLFARCSGAYIGNHPETGNALVLTNAHCVSQCTDDHFIFDASVAENKIEPLLDKNKILTCQRVLFSEFRFWEPDGSRLMVQDMAILEMNRPAPLNRFGQPRQFLRVSSHLDVPVRKGQSLMAVGYPFGLPMKISPVGFAMEDASAGYFNNNLDHFPGNSGSPVVDPIHKKIVAVFQGTASVQGSVENSFRARHGSSPACLEIVSCHETKGCHEFDHRPAAGVAVDLASAFSRAILEGRISANTLNAIYNTKPTAMNDAEPMPEPLPQKDICP